MVILFDTTEINRHKLFDNRIEVLLEQSKHSLVKICISKIVLIETKKHFIEETLEDVNIIKNYIGKLKKINITLDELNRKINSITYDKLSDVFDERILQLEDEYKIEIINYPDNVLNDMIKAYEHSKAPFHKNTGSWKDFLIWKSYEKYLIENNIEDNIFFISNNTKDFYNKSEDSLHEDLLVSFGNTIKVYKSLDNFTKESLSYKEINNKYENDRDFLILRSAFLKKYAEDENDYSSLMPSITDYFSNEITEYLEDIDYINKINIIDNDNFIEEYEFRDYEVNEINDYDIEIKKIGNNELLVTGNIVATLSIDLYERNLQRESSRDDYYIEYEASFEVVLAFSFKVKDIDNLYSFELNLVYFDYI